MLELVLLVFSVDAENKKVVATKGRAIYIVEATEKTEMQSTFFPKLFSEVMANHGGSPPIYIRVKGRESKGVITATALEQGEK